MKAKEEAFIREYIVSKNATQAALKAGYGKTTARFASKWLNPKDSSYRKELKERIDELLSSMNSEKVAKAEEVMAFLTETMRNSKAEVSERLKAAELIGKVHGVFTSNIRVSGSIPIVIMGADELED